MLDSETKSRIDSARDILVGKVPDPKSQVEQITIALIYKFMDDMDRQSEELGGKATFFSGEYKKYAWSRLLDHRFSGHERLLLYAEGIEKMNENKNIPQLFRDIFKGVFLPYRDPETLNLFLKEINGFSYDHSERLGDAFEYLLSVMDSQGSAGQFRTPRHIIDFIVRIVDPKKNETILDPACGTAGFLISSYKHILAQHQNISNLDNRSAESGIGNQKSSIKNQKFSSDLTPDERGRLMTNFCGYDISPDMVRLSRVNLYLHGFANPRIHEYDTLTSEERWDERYDVILANPPFMTPKGGIRPHNRFSIKAKRSEVLFVDYIAEHLNVNGRAGVIVPEGIIFQSQNAYKKLRKMLIENYLWCVVSLPAGCFNPYSGVKTSILLLDKSLTKRTDEILFVKVENDGFDLGAQRRPNGKNDLPETLSAISDFRLRIADLKKEVSDNQKSATENQKPITTHAVKKSRILESGDVNLSGDRYRDTGAHVSTKWPTVKLGEVCEFQYGSSLPERRRVGGPYPVVGSNGITGFHNEYIVKGPTIVVGRKGSAGEVVWIDNDCYPIDTTYYVAPKSPEVSLRYLYYILKHINLSKLRDGAGVPGLNRNDAYGVQIPLPPLEVQEKIVTELDGYRKIIEGAKQIIANYKPTIRIDPKWPTVELCSVADMKRGPFGGSLKKEIFVRNGYKVYEQKHAIQRDVNIGTYFIDEKKYKEMEDFAVAPGDLLISCSGTMGRVFILPPDAPKGVINQALLKVTTNRKKVLGEYLETILTTDQVQNRYFRNTSGSAIQNVSSMKELRSIPIPLPPLDVQRRVVAEIESERELVQANRKLIEIYEQKIQAKLAEIWGEN
ncbi:MAG: N-6 DNA methylase [Thermodesulfobacteriota bacterium]|nr:N-6 DNA methylase [Thermodesulfobacteriota bacterium]